MDLFFRIVIGTLTFLSWLLNPIFKLRSLLYKKRVPKIGNEILKISATGLAEKIRKKQLSSIEVILAYKKRIEEVNPFLNAVVEDRFKEALREAERVDEIVNSGRYSAEDLEGEFPLLGVPLTVKESCKVKDFSFCVGSNLRLGMKAEEDGAAVRKLRVAGAIPLLVSNTPECSLDWECVNHVTGRTLNPYDTSRTSGGSSGGEGALIGSGASVIGIGTDIAGSIRIPCAFNGIFGHKPTPEIISIEGLFPTGPDPKTRDFLVLGPMTRYAEDLELMTRIMCDHPKLINFEENIDIRKLRIFHADKAETSHTMTSVDNRIESAVAKCVQYLKKSGCTIDDYKFDMSDTCQMSSLMFYSMENIPNVMENSEKESVHWELLKALFGCSRYTFHGLYFYLLQRHNVFVSRGKFPVYREKCERLKNDFIEKLRDDGVFVYPVFPTLPFEHDRIFLMAPGVLYSMVFNALGFPSTTVPIGRSEAGLPIGIQIVAAPYRDRLTMAVAVELEKAFGGWSEP